jgi:hypothetical protein
MGEKQRRADVPAKMLQVLVGPGRAHLTIEARLITLAVPAEAEAIAVRAADRFLGLEALHHQRVGGLGDIPFERDVFSSIGDPAAHGSESEYPVENTTAAATAKVQGGRRTAISRKIVLNPSPGGRGQPSNRPAEREFHHSIAGICKEAMWLTPSFRDQEPHSGSIGPGQGMTGRRRFLEHLLA